MSLSDPIGDMIARIKNASLRNYNTWIRLKEEVVVHPIFGFFVFFEKNLFFQNFQNLQKKRNFGDFAWKNK